MMTRRSSCSVGAALGGPRPRSPAIMRYAMSGHQFTPLVPHPETGIRMAARYGYHEIEPFQNDVVKYIKRPPDVFKAVLDEAGIALCTIGSGGQYFDRSRLQETLDNNGVNGALHRAVRLPAHQGQFESTRWPGRSHRG